MKNYEAQNNKDSSSEEQHYNDGADFWRYDIGANVIPANTRKKETYESWKQWQDKPIPQGLHEQWKSSGAFNQGMAIIPGKVWHHIGKRELYLIAIDLDNQKAIEEVALDGLEELAKHLIVEQHRDDLTKAHALLYSHKPFQKKSSDNLTPALNSKLDANEVPAIEVKGQGSHGILFVTPSIHKNGQPYEIIGTLEPIIVDDFVFHINDICKKYGIPYLDGNGDGHIGSSTQIPIQDLFQGDFIVVEGHNRHEALLRAMDSLIKRTMRILGLDEIREIAKRWNDKHCNPPLDNREFEKQWKSATKFIADNNDDDNNNEKDKKGKGKSGNNKGRELDRRRILKTLYDMIVGKFVFKAMIDTGEILYYDEIEDRYKFGAENKIKVELERLWPIAFGIATKDLEFADKLDHDLMPLTEGEREEIVKRIRYRFPVYRREFDADNNIINVKNGLLNIATRRLRPHSPDYLSIKQFPVVYNPQAQPKRLVQFLREVQDVGGENRSSVRLHDISNDRFMLAEFYGKIINAYADISGQDNEDAGTFKALVSGDTIKAQKKHKDPFDFRNTAKLIYSANKLPRSQDDDMFAYAKRWVILQFKSFFKGVNKDRNLIDKLTTEEELSGLLNIALAGFMMLERDGGFEDIPLEEIRKQYDRDDESVLTFLDRECYIDMSKKALVNIFMSETEFFKAYREYFFERFARAENDKPLDNTAFEIELSKYGIFRRRKQIEHKKVFSYMGVITRQEAAQQNLQILEAQRQKTLDS